MLARQSVVGVRRLTTTAASCPGILASSVYVPKRYVDQTDLEEFDGVSPGKYTVGLAQSSMAFVDDREDINTICLNAVQSLMDEYNLSPNDIGRLEVGTETMVDKSKSQKTSLMRLFPGNVDMEGVTVFNACYGGTAGLLNSLAWIESSEWDGRLSIVVAADIASYEAGPARPTGGVGAVAFLVGPDAPLRIVPRSRSTCVQDVYDFYKPQLSSEYPSVDGKLSQVCYLSALDSAYSGHMSKLTAQFGDDETLLVGDAHDYFVFHSPYNKLVQQSFARLFWNDFQRCLAAGLPVPDHLAPLAAFESLSTEESFLNRDLAKTLTRIAADKYDDMVGPSNGLSQSVGNTYTASVFANLSCLISRKGADLEGKRVAMFSYGSGAIATMYSLEGFAQSPHSDFSLQRIADTLNLDERLASRRKAPVSEFLDAMTRREEVYGQANVQPIGSLDHLQKGSWFLKSVDDRYRREYERL